MRAAWYERNGAAREVLTVGEIETPAPGPGEVRVRLVCSGVNPSDVKSRLGLGRAMVYPRVIPHSDGGGTIDAVGSGVSESRVGERVWTWNAAWKRPFGTAAEAIVLPSAQAVRLSDGVSFEVAACLGIPALTAWHAVDQAAAAAGQTLLIAGGAGAVAHYAIQFARARGATVIATISSAEKASHAIAAGANVTINYRTEDVGERVKALTGGAGVDTVIEVDLTANAGLIPSVVRPHGTVVVYGTGPESLLPSAFCLMNNITLRFILVYELLPDARRRATAEITTMLEQGQLQHAIGPRFPLARIAEAHEAQESGSVIGNIIVDLH